MMKGNTKLWMMPAIEFDKINNFNFFAENIVNSVIYNTFGVGRDDVISKSKKSEVVIIRQTAMYFYYQYTNMTFRAIGAAFANKDHATVMHAVKTVSGLMEIDQVFRCKIGKISKNIEKKIGIKSRKSYYTSSELTNVISAKAIAISNRLKGRRRDRDIMDDFDIDLESMYNIRADCRMNKMNINDEKIVLDKIFA